MALHVERFKRAGMHLPMPMWPLFHNLRRLHLVSYDGAKPRKSLCKAEPERQTRPSVMSGAPGAPDIIDGPRPPRPLLGPRMRPGMGLGGCRRRGEAREPRISGEQAASDRKRCRIELGTRGLRPLTQRHAMASELAWLRKRVCWCCCPDGERKAAGNCNADRTPPKEEGFVWDRSTNLSMESAAPASCERPVAASTCNRHDDDSTSLVSPSVFFSTSCRHNQPTINSTNNRHSSSLSFCRRRQCRMSVGHEVALTRVLRARLWTGTCAASSGSEDEGRRTTSQDGLASCDEIGAACKLGFLAEISTDNVRFPDNRHSE